MLPETEEVRRYAEEEDEWESVDFGFSPWKVSGERRGLGGWVVRRFRVSHGLDLYGLVSKRAMSELYLCVGLEEGLERNRYWF